MDTDRFHQAMLVRTPGDLTTGRLADALAALLDHHHALRLRTPDGPGRPVVAPPGSADAAGCLTRVDAAGLADDALRRLVTDHTRRAEDALDPATGAVLRAVWFDAGPGNPGRLLLVLHHLVVDGVSWRILLPDLAAALRDGRSVALPPAGTSLRGWARGLAHAAVDPARAAKLPWWREIHAAVRPLPGTATDRTGVDQLSLALPDDATRPLLSQAFHGRVNDALLAALGLALRRWRGLGEVVVEVERHGRDEHMVPGADLSRTVGWFTSTHPVVLRTGDAAWTDLAGTVKDVKEGLRAVPEDGAGYPLLRHLNARTAAELAPLDTPPIGFNYLGRFATGTSGTTADCALAPENDAAQGAFTLLAHPIEVNDAADGATLVATWSWAADRFTEAEVHGLAELWFEALRALVGHVTTNGAAGRTPADLPLADLRQHEIDALERAHPTLADVLPLAPLQRGLFFHALADGAGDDVYATQLILTLDGPVDPAALRAAAGALLIRHAHLRAGLTNAGLRAPLQFVLADDGEPPWRGSGWPGSASWRICWRPSGPPVSSWTGRRCCASSWPGSTTAPPTWC